LYQEKQVLEALMLAVFLYRHCGRRQVGGRGCVRWCEVEQAAEHKDVEGKGAEAERPVRLLAVP